jgi:hypothetical protein
MFPALLAVPAGIVFWCARRFFSPVPFISSVCFLSPPRSSLNPPSPPRWRRLPPLRFSSSARRAKHMPGILAIFSKSQNLMNEVREANFSILCSDGTSLLSAVSGLMAPDKVATSYGQRLVKVLYSPSPTSLPSFISPFLSVLRALPPPPSLPSFPFSMIFLPFYCSAPRHSFLSSPSHCHLYPTPPTTTSPVSRRTPSRSTSPRLRCWTSPSRTPTTASTSIPHPLLPWRMCRTWVRSPSMKPLRLPWSRGVGGGCNLSQIGRMAGWLTASALLLTLLVRISLMTRRLLLTLPITLLMLPPLPPALPLLLPPALPLLLLLLSSRMRGILLPLLPVRSTSPTAALLLSLLLLLLPTLLAAALLLPMLLARAAAVLPWCR